MSDTIAVVGGLGHPPERPTLSYGQPQDALNHPETCQGVG